ncbi:MAG: phosphoribosyl carboxyaminoimidazole mutase, partial [Planctomycetota bacterium]|nr:phosphoribosyl carboxyaminoimidazole mutase [Planctomycetota bacterium]
NLGGWSALLSMLNSCAANVTVVNIDAGFKAGYLAGLIATTSQPNQMTDSSSQST